MLPDLHRRCSLRPPMSAPPAAAYRWSFNRSRFKKEDSGVVEERKEIFLFLLLSGVQLKERKGHIRYFLFLLKWVQLEEHGVQREDLFLSLITC